MRRKIPGRLDSIGQLLENIFMMLGSGLKKLGLTDKEVAVYIAMLGMGPNTVQTIARKAKIARSTTYVVLGALQRHDLVTQYESGKKTLFSAEDPERLLHILQHKEAELHDINQTLQKLLPQLQALMKKAADQPLVRYYNGIEGLKAIRQEMVMYCGTQDTWYNFAPVDHLSDVFGKDGLPYKSRILKGIRSKTIFTTSSPQLKNELLRKANDHRTERKYISPDLFTSTSGLTIYCDRIAMAMFTGNVGGVIIESKSLAAMMEEFFQLSWQSLPIL